MKKQKVSPVVTVAAAALLSATPALAVSLSSTIAPALPPDTTSVLAVKPDAAAGADTHFNRLKKKALLAKHDLLSEVNRVEQVIKPVSAVAPNLLTIGETPSLLHAASSVASTLPVASTTGETRGPEFAALSNTSVKAQRPTGTDRRNSGKRGRGSYLS